MSIRGTLIVLLAFVVGYLHVVVDQITDDVADLRVERVLLRRATHAHFEEEGDGIGVEVQVVVRVRGCEFLKRTERACSFVTDEEKERKRELYLGVSVQDAHAVLIDADVNVFGELALGFVLHPIGMWWRRRLCEAYLDRVHGGAVRWPSGDVF